MISSAFSTLGQLAQSRENNLDLIRLLLASGVCFTHSFNLLYGEGTDPVYQATGVLGVAGTAVDMFFVISGFLVTQSWLASRGLGDYLKKRVLRIYPGFLVVTLLCGLVFGPLGAADAGAYFAQFDVVRFVRKALVLAMPGIPETLPGIAFPNSINGSLWTISYEFKCYLLVAALGLAGAFRWRWALLGAFVVALAALTLSAEPSNSLRFVTFFMSGMIAWLYRDRIPHTRALLVAALVALPLLVLAARLPDLAMATLGTYLLLYLAYSRSFNAHGFARHGDFSYGTYLYAFPVQQLLVFHFAPHFTGMTLFAASLAITLAFAALSWHLVEKPCLKLKRRSPAPAPMPAVAAP